MTALVLFILSSLSIFSTYVASQELDLDPPNVLIGCEPVTFNISGGLPPYSIALSDMDTPFEPDIILQEATNTTSLPLCLPVLTESQYNVLVSDSSGEAIFIGPIPVQSGPSTTTTTTTKTSIQSSTVTTSGATVTVTVTTTETITQGPSATPGNKLDVAPGTGAAHLSSGARAGIAIGCIAMVALLLNAALLCFRIRRRRGSASAARHTDNSGVGEDSDNDHDADGDVGESAEKDALVAPLAAPRGAYYDISTSSPASSSVPLRRYDPSVLSGMPPRDAPHAAQTSRSSVVAAPRIGAYGPSVRASMLPQPDGPAEP